MASISLPPFLEKLRLIANTTPKDIAGWSEDGKHFLIHTNDFEKKILREHFRGSRQTFIRQLHFYCFKKLDNRGEKWAFYHPKFQRDAPHLIYEIKRKTRTENGGPASKLEVQSVRAEMDSLKRKMQKEIDFLKSQLTTVLERLPERNGTGHNCCCMKDSKGKRSACTAQVYEGLKKKRRKGMKREPRPDPEYPVDSDFKLLDNSLAGVAPFDEGPAGIPLLGDEMFGFDRKLTAEMSFDSDMFDLDFGNEAGLQRKLKGADYFALCADGKFEMPGEKNAKVLISNKDTELLTFGAKAFAGFLLQFVEKTRLLSSQNSLHNFDGYQDKQACAAVLARFPAKCPLRELVENASPYVSRVLLSMLKEVPGDAITVVKNPIGASKDFQERTFLVFKLPDAERKEVNGRGFLSFLSFLLEASLMPADVVSKSQATHGSKVFGLLSSYFKVEMKNVVTIAHSNLAKMRAIHD